MRALARRVCRGGAGPLPGGRKALPYGVAVVLLFAASATLAQPGLPAALERAGLDQRLGDAVPLDTSLTDHRGESVVLGDYFGDKPVLLVPVYYDCPMLCGLVLDGLVRSLKAVSLEPGADFHVVAVSFDPKETSEQAAGRRDTAIARYDRATADNGLHFLTGGATEVTAVMEAIGFRYTYNEESGEFGHAATVVVLTPEGKVARYFLGVEYPPRDLRLSLVEAADDQIGNVVDQVLLYCFKYDPSVGRYTAATMNIVRAGGLLTLALLGTFILLSLRRERQATAGAGA